MDAVLSEDVDTMMFGCSMTLRSWTAEGARGNKSPTHVNLYDAKITKEEKGLDSEGMILIALMSGGDYMPDGIPGCGIKTAYEAAIAGFGRDLCQMSKDDIVGIRQWRERLEHELRTNESKLFRQKHKTMKIPEQFPDKTVWGYYTHPAVSSIDKVARLRSEIKWGLEVNVPELRVFVADAFEWQYLSGAKKFIRGLAPALLPHHLTRRSQMSAIDNEDLEAKETAEQRLVKSVCGRRNGHWDAGGEPELRIAYIPIDIVGLDLDAEEKDDFQGECQDDEQPASEVDEARDRSKSPVKRRGPSTYDPTQIEKIWIMETYVKLGVPLLVETWEEEMRNPKKFASRKARGKAKTTILKGGMESGALNQYVKLAKPRSDDLAAELPNEDTESAQLPPACSAPAHVDVSISQQREMIAENIRPVGQKARKQRNPAEPKATRSRKATSASQTSTPPKDRTTNPWTLAKRTPQRPRFNTPPRETSDNLEKALCIPTPSSAKKRHSRPTTPISEAENPTETTRALNANVTLRRPKHSTPRPHDPTKPSPRKKRSPLQMANDLYIARQLLTPTSTPIRTQQREESVPPAEPDALSSQKVNRRLDFLKTRTTPPPPASIVSITSSPSPSLPSPSTLLHPPNPPEAAPTEAQHSQPSFEVQPPQARARPGRLIALRESLEGAWKHLEPWDDGASVAGPSTGRVVFSGVEVVDLTGG